MSKSRGVLQILGGWMTARGQCPRGVCACGYLCKISGKSTPLPPLTKAFPYAYAPRDSILICYRNTNPDNQTQVTYSYYSTFESVSSRYQTANDKVSRNRSVATATWSVTRAVWCSGVGRVCVDNGPRGRGHRPQGHRPNRQSGCRRPAGITN